MAPLLATVLILAGLAIFVWTISYRIRPLLFARPDVRWDDPATRTEKLLEYGFAQPVSNASRQDASRRDIPNPPKETGWARA